LVISLWLFVFFLIYVSVSEFSLFGPGKIPRLLFTLRPSYLHLNRRQRVHELLRISRLADAHSHHELRDPASSGHLEFMGIVRRLAR
jgi:hypothetical protein